MFFESEGYVSFVIVVVTNFFCDDFFWNSVFISFLLVFDCMVDIFH